MMNLKSNDLQSNPFTVQDLQSTRNMPWTKRLLQSRVSLLAGLLVLGGTSGGIYLIQQQRLDQLQAQNQMLQQQVDVLTVENQSKQQQIAALSSDQSRLTANLQVLCQQPQSRIRMFFERAFDGLIENDFAAKWSQACEGVVSPTQLPQ